MMCTCPSFTNKHYFYNKMVVAWMIFMAVLRPNVCYSLPNVLWDPRNPLFHVNSCGGRSKVFYVKFDDALTILCGNQDINNAVTTKYLSKDQFYYNIFKTENRDAYLNRDSTKAEHMYDCKQSQKYKPETRVYGIFVEKLDLFFKPRNNYKEGKAYYFFSTSDGRKKSLNNTKGVANTPHMGIEVHVCKFEESCEDRNRVNVCIGGPMTGKQTGQNTGDKLSDPKVIVIILAALMFGLLCGFIGAVVHYKGCLRDRRTNTAEPDYNRQNSKASSNISTVSDTQVFISQP